MFYSAAAIVVLVVFFGIFEAALRVVGGDMYVERATIELNTDYEYRNIPGIKTARLLEDGTVNVLELNSEGFGGREFTLTKPPNTKRVMILGDSFVEGKSVKFDDMFASKLQKILDARGSYEVIPRGTSSWATENEVLYLEREGLKYDPDVVVIAFFANDIRDNRAKKLITVDEGGLKRNVPYSFSPSQVLQLWCRSSSEVCGFFRIKVLPLFQQNRGQDGIYWGISEDLITVGTTEDTSLALDETREIFKDFSRISKERGFKPVILIVPFREQVEASSTSALIKRLNLNPSDVYMSKINDWVAEAGAEAGVDVWDPREIMIGKALSGNLYYEYDHHLNPYGNDVIASYLADEVDQSFRN